MIHEVLKILVPEDVAYGEGWINRALLKENIFFDGSRVDIKRAFPDGINRFRPDVTTIWPPSSTIQFTRRVKYLSQPGLSYPFYFS
jgi:hypothetical protein